MLEELIRLDTNVFLFLNDLHNPFWDQVMWFITQKETWYPLYALILFFVFRQYRWTGFWVFLAMALVVTLADQISVKVFKFGLERPRPSHNEALDGLIHIINNYRGGAYGFVSSHAANTFGFATLTTRIFNQRWVVWALFIWATVVSYSRIYLGVHYPGDIIGGALLGIIIGYSVYLLYRYLMQRIAENYSTKQYE